MKEDHSQVRLSPHFTLAEFEASAVAEANHIDNTAPDAVAANLRRICEKVLEPVREKYGPVVVTSGFRTGRLNALVGGVKCSQHKRGEAVDFVVRSSRPLYAVWMWMKTHLPYDQLIYELRPQTEQAWIHVSLTKVGNRGQSFVKHLGVADMGHRERATAPHASRPTPSDKKENNK